MTNFKNLLYLSFGLFCLVVTPLQELNAGLFGKKLFKGIVSKPSKGVRFVEPSSQVTVDLRESWHLSLPSEITGPVWLGTTYREVPYTEVEFNKLRDEKVAIELDRIRQDHIRRVKAEKSKEGAAVDDLLSDLLAEGQEEKEEDLSKYLVDFDEEAVRRRVANRTFVSQTRYVPIPAVYLTLKNQQIFCIDLKTGITSWVYSLKLPIRDIPFETEEELFLVQAGSCYVIDKQTGLATEKVNFDRAVHPVLYSNQGRLYPVGYGNRVASWTPKRSVANWYHKLSGAVNGGVFGHSEGLLFPLSNGELTSLSFEGEEKWTFISKSHSDEKIYLEKIIEDLNKEVESEKKEASREDRDADLEVLDRLEKETEAIEDKINDLKDRARGMYLAKPHEFGESLIIGSTDFNLYNLNRFSGLPEWSYSCGASLKEEALGSGDWVYVRDSKSRLHKVGYASGKGEVMANGLSRLLGALDELACYEKDDKVWLDWKSSKGYFDGWDSKNTFISKDMKQLIGIDRSGVIRVWNTEGIRQLPQG